MAALDTVKYYQTLPRTTNSLPVTSNLQRLPGLLTSALIAYNLQLLTLVCTPRAQPPLKQAWFSGSCHKYFNCLVPSPPNIFRAKAPGQHAVQLQKRESWPCFLRLRALPTAALSCQAESNKKHSRPREHVRMQPGQCPCWAGNLPQSPTQLQCHWLR